jgi:hypothetical protein
MAETSGLDGDPDFNDPRTHEAVLPRAAHEVRGWGRTQRHHFAFLSAEALRTRTAYFVRGSLGHGVGVASPFIWVILFFRSVHDNG